LKTVCPKGTGVRIPLPAPKNKDTPCGCPLFFASVRGDEPGGFAYRRHTAYHEAQSIRGICVARGCRLKFISKRNGFYKSHPEQHTPLPAPNKRTTEPKKLGCFQILKNIQIKLRERVGYGRKKILEPFLEPCSLLATELMVSIIKITPTVRDRRLGSARVICLFCVEYSYGDLFPLLAVAPASLHRRIVVACRLRRLGSANSLLWAVSLRQKQHSVVFNLLHVILEDFFLLIGKAFLQVLVMPCHVPK